VRPLTGHETLPAEAEPDKIGLSDERIRQLLTRDSVTEFVENGPNLSPKGTQTVHFGGKSLTVLRPHVFVNPPIGDRLRNRSDIADVYKVGIQSDNENTNKPIAAVSAEIFDYMLTWAEDYLNHNHSTLKTDFKEAPKEYKPHFNEDTLIRSVQVFRKVCGNDTSAKAFITDSGASSTTTNRMGRTLYLFDPKTVTNILNTSDKASVIERSGFPLDADRFMQEISVKQVPPENEELRRILNEDFYPTRGQKANIADLHAALGIQGSSLLA
jgi:hypothetical protein